MKKRAMTLALCLLPAAACAHDPPSCEDSTPAVCYAKDMVRSLEHAHRGTVGSMDTTGVGGAPAILAQAVLNAAKRQQAAVESATKIVDDYTNAEDSVVRYSAQLLGASYSALAMVRSRAVEAIKAELDGKSGTAGAVAERTAEIHLMRRRAAEGLVFAVVALTHGLLSADKQALNMTADERAAVLSQIESSFGKDMEPVNGQFASDYIPPVETLRRFLTDSWEVQR